MEKRSLILIISGILVMGLLFYFYFGGYANTTADHVVFQGKTIFVDVADTDEKRALGLMFEETLCEDCGMLFVFETEDIYPFWMKNTLIPLDIVFIDGFGRIVDVVAAEPCGDEECYSYKPAGKALYVLEVNQGMFELNDIGKEITIAID